MIFEWQTELESYRRKRFKPPINLKGQLPAIFEKKSFLESQIPLQQKSKNNNLKEAKNPEPQTNFQESL